jgi:hypothetical protein
MGFWPFFDRSCRRNPALSVPLLGISSAGCNRLGGHRLRQPATHRLEKFRSGLRLQHNLNSPLKKGDWLRTDRRITRKQRWP